MAGCCQVEVDILLEQGSGCHSLHEEVQSDELKAVQVYVWVGVLALPAGHEVRAGSVNVLVHSLLFCPARSGGQSPKSFVLRFRDFVPESG